METSMSEKGNHLIINQEKTVFVIGKRVERKKLQETKYRQVLGVELYQQIKSMLQKGKEKFIFYSCGAFENLVLGILQRFRTDYPALECIHFDPNHFAPIWPDERFNLTFSISNLSDQKATQN